MKNNSTLKTISIGLISLVLLISFMGCCEECCSPSIEVGVIKPGAGALSHYQPGMIEMWTWDPITKFPRNPNLKLTDLKLDPLRPYLAKAKVTNYSDVEVRGVTVAFYWASFGLFDRGTPIGAVAVDLPPNSTRLVSSPWSFTLGEKDAYSLCLSVRVFHPCDRQLENNYCYKNFIVAVLPWPWKIHAYPFVVDFSELEGRVEFRVEAPDGIQARVVPKPIRGEAVPGLENMRAIKDLVVERGIPHELSLVIENQGAAFNRGDTFDVTVTALQQNREVSSFTVNFKVGQDR